MARGTAAQLSSPSRTAIDHRTYYRLAAAILVVAGVWRAAIAWTLPCLARDSVTFCWYARDLGEQGVAYLRQATTQQHPLYPVCVLGAQRIGRMFGAPDTPMTWQRSGQAVSWLAGMAVVILAGAFAGRLVRRLELPLDDRLATCCGMLLAALLPLNVWLSSEVMSDQLHLAFYLFGVWTLLKLDGVKAALLCGVAGGLAFLTRPEGIVVIAAGLVALAVDRGASWRGRVLRSMALILGLLVCAAPLWALAGTFSLKKNPLNWLRAGDEAASLMWRGWPFMLARLELLNLSWYALVPWALYQLIRAGRVVVPLLAFMPLLNLRRRLLRPPLAGLTVCLVGHFALTVYLLQHYHYLDQRHMLVVAVLLVPLAATLLARLVELAWRRRSGPLGIIVAVCVIPLALYSLVRPNVGGRYLIDAARRLADHDPLIRTKAIMTASSERPLVFYAAARWVYWYDGPGAEATPAAQILRDRPDYFIIAAGAGFERDGNVRVSHELGEDKQLAGRIRRIDTLPAADNGRLNVFVFDWSEP